MGWSFPERVLAKTPSGQIISVEPWDGGISLENRQSLMAEASRRVGLIAQQLRAHPDCLSWRASGASDFEWMLQHAATGPRDLRGLLEQPDEDGELAGPIFRDIISYLYGRSMPVFQETEVLQLEPAEEIFGFLSERRARIKQDAARALRACALPLDEWHQAVASALLIAPHLARWAVSAPIGMSPRPEDQSDLERQAFAATGSSVPTERHAITAKRDMQDRLRYERRRERPGPKRGSRNRRRPARLAFERYVADQDRRNVSVQIIAAQAEAVRLYHAIPGIDHAKPLSDSAVRRAIRNANELGAAGS